MLPIDQLSATVDKYITEQAITEIFHPRVISACIVVQTAAKAVG